MTRFAPAVGVLTESEYHLGNKLLLLLARMARIIFAIEINLTYAKYIDKLHCGAFGGACTGANQPYSNMLSEI